MCEVGCGLFRLDLAHYGKREYSSHAKSSPYQFFCCGSEEQACGGLHVRIVLFAAFVFISALLFVFAALELLFLSSSPHWALQLHRDTSR